jgi:hypothetical protein
VKKLSELKKNLEKAQTTHETDNTLVGEELQFREFNGHRYKVTTFDMEVHCQYCNDLLVKRQGLFCLSKTTSPPFPPSRKQLGFKKTKFFYFFKFF